MFAVIGTVDNYTILPSPVLDDADPKGYRIEQRLQVTLKLAANERQQYTVEFRLGDESQAPSTDLLTKWLESGELVQAYLRWTRRSSLCPLEGEDLPAPRSCRADRRPDAQSSTPSWSSLARPWPCSNLAHRWRSRSSRRAPCSSAASAPTAISATPREWRRWRRSSRSGSARCRNAAPRPTPRRLPLVKRLAPTVVAAS